MRPFSYLLRDFMQIAYVSEDLDAATSYLESTLGTVRCEKHYKSSLGGIVIVDGERAEEWVIDVALVNAGPVNLEVICPVSGAVELYRGAIRPGVPATLHHLGFRIPDFDEATSILSATGKTWKQFGHVEGAIRFGYVDMTAELGHYIEFMDLERAAVDRFAALEAASNLE